MADHRTRDVAGILHFLTPLQMADEIVRLDAVIAGEAPNIRMGRLPPGVAVTSDSELTKALRDAATSLETIASLSGRKTYGNPPIETFMETFMDVRLYAAARARAARESLDGAQGVNASVEPSNKGGA